MGSRQINSFIHDKENPLVDFKLNVSEKVSAQEVMDPNIGSSVCIHTEQLLDIF